MLFLEKKNLNKLISIGNNWFFIRQTDGQTGKQSHGICLEVNERMNANVHAHVEMLSPLLNSFAPSIQTYIIWAGNIFLIFLVESNRFKVFVQTINI